LIFFFSASVFLVGGDLVEQRLERAGLLAGFHQVHEQIIEVQRMLGECLVQRGARFDVGLDGEHQFCIEGFSWPLPMMSKHCTIGMPACSMVASWRANSAISSEVIFCRP